MSLTRWDPFHELVSLREAMDRMLEVGGGATVEYNRGAVMVLPPGATKGTGLRYALNELGYSPRNVVACGDAENDRSLFEVAEVSVAVANALPNMQALADVVLPQADGAGVQALIEELLAGRTPARRPRPERRLLLGHSHNGTPVHLDPFTLVWRRCCRPCPPASGIASHSARRVACAACWPRRVKY